MGILDDLKNTFDPSKNGFNKAMDPSKNGFNKAMEPVGKFLNNEVKNGAGNFFKNTVPTFFKDTVGPLVKNLYDTFLVAPMKFINDLFKAGSGLLSGSSLTYLLIGVGGIVVIGGIVYYNQKGKLT